MADKPKTMQEWLKEIYPDQNLTQLSDLEDIEWEYLRNIFLSLEIKPEIIMGFLDNNTEQIVNGIERNELTGESGLVQSSAADALETSAVSAATTDFVITDGQTWEIYGLGLQNQSQASTIGYYYYDGTNTYPLPGNYDTENGNVNRNVPMVFTRPFRITGNGTIALRAVANAFGAGNNMRASLWYRRVA